MLESQLCALRFAVCESRCIDAGNPNSMVGSEPTPNVCIINMGAYGGTSQDSMSPPDDDNVVQ